MHVTINTLPLDSGHKKRGIGIYTKLLIESLAKYEPSHTYTYFSKVSDIPTDTDIVHYPFFDPFIFSLPMHIGWPAIVTVHDLIPITYPKHFPRGVRGEIKWQVQKRILPRVAKRIITDSISSRKDISEVLSYSPEAIDVVPLAPRPVLQRISDRKRLSDVKKKYLLSNKFVLYVGDVNWNKNILGLLNSYSVSNKFRDDNYQLVLVGKAFTDSELVEVIEIQKLIDKLKLTKLVKMVGYVSDDDLACLYSMAQLFVYPSFVEGFGFPILEAMACGCPVVTSNVASCREIAGPSTLVNPYDAHDISRGMQSVINLTPTKKSELIQKGFEWVSKFTWEKTAKETVAAYNRVLSNL